MNCKLSNVVGLIPAAGTASRISPLPCSKEILPVAVQADADGNPYPKAAIHFLLEKYRNAGIGKAFIVLRKEKRDIPHYLGDGTNQGVYLAYLFTGSPQGVPFSLNGAYPFIKQHIIAFGFPDILFHAANAYRALIEKQLATNADIVLGLFKPEKPNTADMVAVDDKGVVRHIEIKPVSTTLEFAWIIAVWTPAFTAFIHRHLKHCTPRLRPSLPERAETHFGDVIQAGINAHIVAESVVFNGETFCDIGVPGSLACLYPGIHTKAKVDN